ncbi:MAG TPA: glycosyltransferase family 4 protein [Acidimicrobiia bacterium]|nr:glycosyltransferase family 4 protein [Acidimicrobiia bacterium]
MPTQMAPWQGATGHGIEIHLACAPFDDFGRVPEVAPPHPINVHRLNPLRLRRGQTWWTYPGLGGLIKDLKPDLVHVATEAYGLLFSQMDFRRYPVTGHTADNIWSFGPSPERAIRLRRATRVLRRLSGLASWNQAGLDLARKFGLREGIPTVVVPSRLSASEPFEEAVSDRAAHRRALGFDSKCIVGFVGRLSPEKGLDWLIESFAASDERERSRLVVFGSGPLEGAWRELAGRLGVDVTYVGAVPPEGIPAVLAALDILVVPSLTFPDKAEQFSRIAVEAMFSGTPVIASRSGAIPEVIGDAGTLVAEGSRPELTAALDLLITNPALRSAVGAKGQAFAKARYSADVLGANLADFWRRSSAAGGRTADG